MDTTLTRVYPSAGRLYWSISPSTYTLRDGSGRQVSGVLATLTDGHVATSTRRYQTVEAALRHLGVTEPNDGRDAYHLSAEDELRVSVTRGLDYDPLTPGEAINSLDDQD